MTQPGRPAVFIHGLWLHASSWAPWLELFQEAGYAPTAPGWPGDPETVEESFMRRIFVAAFAGLVSIGAGVAADDPIHARKALMGANGKISKPIVAIMKGAPFQLEAVQAALKQYIETSEKAATLFPPGSDKGMAPSAARPCSCGVLGG